MQHLRPQSHHHLGRPAPLRTVRQPRAQARVDTARRRRRRTTRMGRAARTAAPAGTRGMVRRAYSRTPTLARKHAVIMARRAQQRSRGTTLETTNVRVPRDHSSRYWKEEATTGALSPFRAAPLKPKPYCPSKRYADASAAARLAETHGLGGLSPGHSRHRRHRSPASPFLDDLVLTVRPVSYARICPWAAHAHQGLSGAFLSFCERSGDRCRSNHEGHTNEGHTASKGAVEASRKEPSARVCRNDGHAHQGCAHLPSAALPHSPASRKRPASHGERPDRNTIIPNSS